MVPKLVPAARSLLGNGRTPTPVASKITLSPATGAIPPTQFAPVVQLLFPPPPFQVRVAAAAAVDVAASTTAMPMNCNSSLHADRLTARARVGITGKEAMPIGLL